MPRDTLSFKNVARERIAGLHGKNHALSVPQTLGLERVNWTRRQTRVRKRELYASQSPVAEAEAPIHFLDFSERAARAYRGSLLDDVPRVENVPANLGVRRHQGRRPRGGNVQEVHRLRAEIFSDGRSEDLCDARQGSARHGTGRYGTVRHGTARYGTVRHGTSGVFPGTPSGFLPSRREHAKDTMSRTMCVLHLSFTNMVGPLRCALPPPNSKSSGGIP